MSCAIGLVVALNGQGRRAEAEKEAIEALKVLQASARRPSRDQIVLKVYLGSILHSEGKPGEAEGVLTQAAEEFLKARVSSFGPGLGGAAWSKVDSPLGPLACQLVRNSKPAAAWDRLEQALGRSTWDEITAHARSSPDDFRALAVMRAGLKQLETTRDRVPVRDRPRREALFEQAERVREQIDAFYSRLEKKSGFTEGVSYPLGRIQATMAPELAFLAWEDSRWLGSPKESDHWAVVLRSRGDPAWIRIAADEDAGRPGVESPLVTDRLYQALASPSDPKRSHLADLVRRLKAERIEPIRGLLKARDGLPDVRHLVVLPSAYMARTPVELLLEHENITVSYAPSATVFTHLRERPPPRSSGLLAVGDPLFDTEPTRESGERPPDQGVLVESVQPSSNAARARPIALAPDDIVLSYNGRPIRGIVELQAAIRQPGLPEWVRVSLWRDGKTHETEVRPGSLGVVLNKDPRPSCVSGGASCSSRSRPSRETRRSCPCRGRVPRSSPCGPSSRGAGRPRAS